MNSINEKLKEGFIMESIAFNISERNEKGKKSKKKWRNTMHSLW